MALSQGSRVWCPSKETRRLSICPTVPSSLATGRKDKVARLRRGIWVRFALSGFCWRRELALRTPVWRAGEPAMLAQANNGRGAVSLPSASC